MTEKGTSFRIDVILQSVNELRQEKRALEQKYGDEKNRNKSLEVKLEQDSARLNQSKERNVKMQETVKVAQQKVSQTDSQADRLTEINDAKQNCIAELNDQIKLETNEEDHDVSDFEMKLLEFTGLFRNAKQVYAKDSLNKEIKVWKENMEALVTEAERKTVELGDVTKAFENLSIDTNRIKELVGEKMGHEGLTYKDLQLAIDLLTRKRERINKLLHWIETCWSRANTWLEECGINNPVNEEAHMQQEEGQMDFPRESCSQDHYHFPSDEHQYHSDLPSQTLFQNVEPNPRESNFFPSNNQRTPILQNSFFISLPFSRSR